MGLTLALHKIVKLLNDGQSVVDIATALHLLLTAPTAPSLLALPLTAAQPHSTAAQPHSTAARPRSTAARLRSTAARPRSTAAQPSHANTSTQVYIP